MRLAYITKNNNMQKKIITFIIILFIISSAYLLWTAKNYNDPDYQKNWWAVYFENPKSDNPSFVIENHSDKNSFHYVILAGSDKMEEKDVMINKGEVRNIKTAQVNIEAGKKITVQVVLGEDKKEVYKNFDK
jgi:hypothetical protein